MCFRWSRDLDRILLETRSLSNVSYQHQSGMKLKFDSMVIAIVANSHTECSGKPAVGEEKQKQIKETFKAVRRRLLNEAQAIPGSITKPSSMLRKTLKTFPYRG